MVDEALVRDPGRHIDYLPDQYRPGALRRALRYLMKLGVAEYPHWFELDQGGRWNEQELLRAEQWFHDLGPDIHAKLLNAKSSDARLISLVPDAFMRHLSKFVERYVRLQSFVGPLKPRRSFTRPWYTVTLRLKSQRIPRILGSKYILNRLFKNRFPTPAHNIVG